MGKKTKELLKTVQAMGASVATQGQLICYIRNMVERIEKELVIPAIAERKKAVVSSVAKDATTPEPGSFTDARDGQTYRTVKMPDGKIWMAQNLNYKPMDGGVWAYGKDEANREKYGLLYDWNTAKRVCPVGWHLPTRKEWQALVAACGDSSVAGMKLKSTSGWNNKGNGTDDYGFSALPGGGRYSDGDFDNAGGHGYWWTATEDSDGYAYFRYMGYNYDNLHELNNVKDYGFSVRCVGD